MKIGIFGGTFSPPHIGHISAAKSFKEQLNLDKLLIIPCGIPPHKNIKGNVSSQDRFIMSQLAFSSFSEISDYEISKEGKSYTVDTVLYLKSIYSSDSLYLLIGDDMLFSFNSWYKPEIICNNANICYISRGESDENIKNKADELSVKYCSEFTPVLCKPLVISSTDIRSDIMKYKNMLPTGVFNYIKEHNLYNV